MNSEKKLQIEKSNKLRERFGWGIFLLLICLAEMKYVSYNFPFQLSIPLMAIIMVYNSLLEYCSLKPSLFEPISLNEKKMLYLSRIIILAFFLAITSFGLFFTISVNKRKADKVISLCIKSINDPIICDKISEILHPSF